MSDNDLDPGANTQMFQAFVDRGEPEASTPGWKWAALAGAALVALVIVSTLAWLILRG